MPTRVVITRAAVDARPMAELVRAWGAEPVLYPCIDFAPPPETAALDCVVRAAAAKQFGCLVFTSAHAVQGVAQRLEQLNLAAGDFDGVAVAAVGSVTAQAVRQLLRLPVTLVPENFTAHSLARCWAGLSCERVLVLQADRTTPSLAELLGAHAAEVVVVGAYRAGQGRGGVALLPLLRSCAVAAITFTSPSIVHNFLERLGREGGDAGLLAHTCVACIGPTTAAAAAKQGIHVSLVPSRYTVEALIAELRSYVGGSSRGTLQHEARHAVNT